MSTQSMMDGAERFTGGFRGLKRPAVAGYGAKMTEMRLREALAREQALRRERDELLRTLAVWREAAAVRVAGLTRRQQQILEMVLAGQPSKNIAADLCISQRTVENHRAEIMKRTGTRSLPAPARLALVATWNAAAVLAP
jgi:FixJ family two-component response regulator